MAKSVSNRYNWIFESASEAPSKEQLVNLYVSKILTRTQKMFKYENLPKTIPQKDLELILQCCGSATVTKVNGELYAFRAGLGGEPNVYYLPTKAVVSNPYLNYNGTLTIDEDCVVILNDALYEGLMPLIKKTAYLLAECDISFKFAAINTRIPALVNAPSDKAKKEAEEFFKKIENGDELGVIADEDFFQRISVYDYANKDSNIQHLIELKQYIIGTFYQDIGIQAAFNMKREAINESEAALSQDILYPLVDEMLTQRKIGLEKINSMYGTNIKVELDSIWKQLRKQQELAFDLQKAEINKEDVNEQSSESVDDSN